MLSDPLEISPVDHPLCGTVCPPGSKSLTNRALVLAALAEGTSHLSGLLDSRDTQVLRAALEQLGIDLQVDTSAETAVVRGSGGAIPASRADLWLENSGTSIRFLTAVCALGRGTYRLDGNERMRQRPIGDLLAALRELGVEAVDERGTGCPPVLVHGRGLPGGKTTLPGNTSSQFLSALLMAAPCAAGEITIHISGELVSRPYVEMTCGLMNQFGVQVTAEESATFRIVPQKYRAVRYHVEPDASAASYFFAAAAITGGTITVPGLSRSSLQGDVHFVDVLEQMGCAVEWGDDSLTVYGGDLQGVDVDMNAISDTAQTLAAVAVFAKGPTRIRHVQHMRFKETDRIAAVVTEMNRLGIAAEETADGLIIPPGTPQPGVVQTYDDHRMAMSFALLGLRVPGIRIADPQCTAKTYPGFFDDLQRLCRSAE